jgi:hypothetical protein
MSAVKDRSMMIRESLSYWPGLHLSEVCTPTSVVWCQTRQNPSQLECVGKVNYFVSDAALFEGNSRLHQWLTCGYKIKFREISFISIRLRHNGVGTR